MSGFVLKPAAAPVAFVMDWRRGHLAPGERVTRDLGWTVQPGGAAAGDGAGALRVERQAHDAKASWAVFEGGAPGRAYIVTNRVRTSDDRVLARAIVIRITPDPAAAPGGARPES